MVFINTKPGREKLLQAGNIFPYFCRVLLQKAFAFRFQRSRGAKP